VIEVVVFAPLKTAKTIIRARMEQENDADEQTGGNGDEEGKDEEAKNVGEKVKPEGTALSKKADDLRKLREKMAALKQGRATKAANEDDKKEVEEENDIEVKDEFVASGSRDKRIKLWNAKKGI
jgi:hypothetical protein